MPQGTHITYHIAQVMVYESRWSPCRSHLLASPTLIAHFTLLLFLSAFFFFFCSKHLPFGGQGANQAILDSVHLVNQLYAIPTASLDDIAKSFKAFYANRSTNARDVYKSVGLVSTVLSSRGFGSELMRNLALSKTPKWLSDLGMDGMNTDRPVLCFLPAPDVEAAVKARPQAVPVHYKNLLKSKGLQVKSGSILSASSV